MTEGNEPTFAEKLAALQIQIAELADRMDALEAKRAMLLPIVPKWDDMEHRHTEEEFVGR